MKNIIEDKKTFQAQDLFLSFVANCGARMRLISVLLTTLLSGIPNLYMNASRQTFTMFNHNFDPLNDESNSLFLIEFWQGRENYQKCLFLSQEAQKYNLSVSPSMLKEYEDKIFLNKKAKQKQLSNWGISSDRFNAHISRKILSDIMERIVQKTSTRNVNFVYPTKMKCSVLFIKDNPINDCDVDMKKAIKDNSSLLVDAERRSGYVLKFIIDKRIDEIKDYFNKNNKLSNYDKFCYIKSIFNPDEIKCISKFKVPMDDGLEESFMMFVANDDPLVFNNWGYWSYVEDIETSHVKRSVLDQDLSLLKKRSSAKMGSLTELYKLNQLLVRFRKDPEILMQDDDVFYRKDLEFDFNTMDKVYEDLQIASLRKGSVSLINNSKSDKPCLFIVNDVEYKGITSEIKDLFKSGLSIAKAGMITDSDIFVNILFLSLIRSFLLGDRG